MHKTRWLLGAHCAGSPPTPTCIWMLIPTTTWHSVLSTLVHWTRAICNQRSFSFHSLEKIHLERIKNHWPSFLLLDHCSAASAGCYQDIILTTKVVTFLQPIKDDLGLKMLGIYSIPLGVGWSTLDKSGVPLSQGSKNTSCTSNIIWRNQQWLRRA